MKVQVWCPHCRCKLNLPHHIIRATIHCPQCGHVYEATLPARSRPAPVPAPAEEPELQPSPALLTSGHACQHCGALIESPAGRSRATVVCPVCDNKTSVYAILHRCPTCRQLLESPSRSAGTPATCPRCLKALRVPKDVLLAEAPADAEEFWFGCYCPGCSGEVAARATDAGTYAVCPHCLIPLTVPHGGHYLQQPDRAPAHDPLHALHDSKQVECPGCHSHFPARAPACPVCGTSAPAASPW